jgi:drug/metabolite transporter superfamily protein YnfA
MTIDFQALASNPMVTLGGVVLGLLGIVLAIVFYFRAKREKKPYFEVASNTLIEGIHKSLDGLQLQYKGAPQDRITVTKVAFWNAGRDTINKNDLVMVDPIGIICSKRLAILDVQVIQVSSPSNSVSLGEAITRSDEIFFPIEFEYLDEGDFFVVQIVHAGEKSERFKVSGKIKSVKQIERISGTRIEPDFLNLIPFAFAFEKMIASRVFIKYGGSLIYVGFGLFGVWNLLHEKTQWYIWVLTAFCFFGAAVLYYGHRHIPPVRI